MHRSNCSQLILLLYFDSTIAVTLVLRTTYFMIYVLFYSLLAVILYF